MCSPAPRGEHSPPLPTLLIGVRQARSGQEEDSNNNNSTSACSWDAQITHHGRRHSLGAFPTQREAVEAYDRAVIYRDGEDAITNLPLHHYQDLLQDAASMSESQRDQALLALVQGGDPDSARGKGETQSAANKARGYGADACHATARSCGWEAQQHPRDLTGARLAVTVRTVSASIAATSAMPGRTPSFGQVPLAGHARNTCVRKPRSPPHRRPVRPDVL